MDDRDRFVLQQWEKTFFEINVFAGADGRLAGIFQANVLIGELPGDHVFEPGEVVFVQSLCEANASSAADVTEMIQSQRNLVADDVANGADVVGQMLDPLIGKPNAGERMHDVRR